MANRASRVEQDKPLLQRRHRRPAHGTPRQSFMSRTVRSSVSISASVL